MISYIKGTLVHRGNGVVVVEASGLGYEIFVSAATLSVLPEVGETVKIHTHMNVKEDGISLYGFSTAEELELFHRLISVTGVGPKGALGFLSQLKPQEIILAILSDDVKTLSKAPGVGRKTAQRVILELKDKFKGLEIEDIPKEEIFAPSSDYEGEAVSALVVLGYSPQEAKNALRGAEGSVEEMIKMGLKNLAKGSL